MAVLLIATDLPAGKGLDDTPLGVSLDRQTGWTIDALESTIVGTVMIDHDTALADGALKHIREALADADGLEVFTADSSVDGRACLRGAWSPTRIAENPAELDLVVTKSITRQGSLTDRTDAVIAANDAVGHLPHVLAHRAAAIIPSGDELTAVRRAFSQRRTLDAADSASVIIPTAGARSVDGEPLVHAAIDAARHGGITDLEILLVVGDEYDGDPEALIDGPDIRLVRRPPGAWNFSASINLGLLAAHNELVLLLNDDIEAAGTDGFLREMAGHLEDPTIGVVGALLLYPDRRVQHAGMVIDDALPLHCFSEMTLDEAAQLGGLISRDVAAVTGACLLTRRQDLLTVGGLNEQLPFGFNDVDLCFKFHRRGLRVVLDGSARLIHHEGASRDPVTEGWEWDRFVGRWGEVVDPWYHPGFVRPDDPENRRRNADHIAPSAPFPRYPMRSATVRSQVHYARRYSHGVGTDPAVGSTP